MGIVCSGNVCENSSTSLDTTRRQVIGDAFLIEKGLRTGWSDVFAHEGERFLASGNATTKIFARWASASFRCPSSVPPPELQF
jgi:hypothetical protein